MRSWQQGRAVGSQLEVDQPGLPYAVCPGVTCSHAPVMQGQGVLSHAHIISQCASAISVQPSLSTWSHMHLCPPCKLLPQMLIYFLNNAAWCILAVQILIAAECGRGALAGAANQQTERAWNFGHVACLLLDAHHALQARSIFCHVVCLILHAARTWRLRSEWLIAACYIQAMSCTSHWSQHYCGSGCWSVCTASCLYASKTIPCVSCSFLALLRQQMLSKLRCTLAISQPDTALCELLMLSTTSSC